MKNKKNIRRFLSGFLAMLTVLSTILSPMLSYAADVVPVPEEPPLYEEVKNELDADDGSYQLLCTDIGAAEDGTGVIVNLSGEVVGIIDQSISDNSSKRLVTGYGISGLKSEIELLSNGQAVPYVGIRGLDVTAEIEAQGIPNGVYVQTVEPDSPAMAAGIQSGDIITEAAGKKISSLAVYQSVMRDQKSDSKIRLKGQRQGSGGYVDISFDVTVGSKE